MINEFEDFMWLYDALVDDRIVIEHKNDLHALSIYIEYSYMYRNDSGRLYQSSSPQRVKFNCGIIRWDQELPLYTEEFCEWEEFNSFLKCFIEDPELLVATLVKDFCTGVNNVD